MSSYSKSGAAGVVLLVTIIEDAGLIAWLVLARASMFYKGIPIAPLLLLLVLLIEHSIMQRAENPNFTGRVFAQIFGFSLLEVFKWSVWLTLVTDKINGGSGEAERIEQSWLSERWNGIRRPYSAKDVCRLRGTVNPEHTIAKLGAEKFGRLLKDEPYIPTLGALTGAQALQIVQAGLKAIYMSGWQVAADANLSGQTYPDLSLYPSNSVPHLVK